MRYAFYLITFLALIVSSCKSTNEKSEISNSIKEVKDSTYTDKMVIEDPHSFAKPNEAIVKHLNLEMAIDFESKTLSGIAHWNIESAENATEIIFDTKELNIEKVWINNEQEAEYNLGNHDPIFGSALKVKINEATKVVSIKYQTSPGAEALMWLEPAQTQGKTHPFFFTQSQAILARTWIPCQDGPGVRYTYQATVTTPDGLMAAMSASNPTQKSATNT
ncbi:MAG: hypothetical protein ACPGLV_15270 [Bacteroidia bacterium]